MTMELVITKADFEKAVPAAREPKGKIFEVLEDVINYEVANIENQVLGEVGAQAVEADTHSALAQTVKRLACIRAFLNEMRGLDLVLTATGFGVVSTQDTAPASKMRVDALDGELRRQERIQLGWMITLLFSVTGWSQSQQRQEQVPTLFYCIQQMERFAGINRPKPEDWDNAVPSILAADSYLRKHICDAYMEELLTELTSATNTASNAPIRYLCVKFIGAWIAQNHQLKEELYMRLINRLEADLSQDQTYANSEAYRLNHFKPYENHAEDSAFHFVG